MKDRRFLCLAALLLFAAALLVSCATAGHRGDTYVRFMSQGEEIAAFNISKGEQVVVPEAPIREGYTFNGWWVTSEKGVLEYSEFKIPDDNASDIIVNARWLNTSFTMKRLDFNTDGAIQDGTIYKQHLLKFNGDGTCKVYSLLTNELVSTFTLDRSNVIKMHSNSVCLGPFLSRTDMLPLFYSNVYNSYSSELDKKKGTVGVYKLFYNGNAYSSMLIQLIRIGFTDDRNLWMSAVGSDRSPYGNFVVDPINNKIWFFVTRDANKTTRFFCFELPTPGAGEFDATSGVNVYTLTADDHFMLFSDEKITPEAPVEVDSKELDEEGLRMRHLLQTKLSDMELSVRALNCLKAANIDSFADLVSHQRGELMKFRNFGKKSMNEIETIVEKHKLTFGMDVRKYGIEPKPPVNQEDEKETETTETEIAEDYEA